MSSADSAVTREGGATAIAHAAHELGGWRLDWRCEKWDQDKVDHVLKHMIQEDDDRLVFDDTVGILVPHQLGPKKVLRPMEEGLPSDFLREYGVDPDDITVVEGNLLVNEGIQRLLDLLIAAGGTAYNNANAFLGVGDSNTAEAATQTELSAATNRFYKAMRTAGFPVRPGSNGAQSVDWSSDFTTTEANYAWAEWSISAGATTASGAGFTTGTTNLNRKVQSLGTKSTGTWTLTGTVTIS